MKRTIPALLVMLAFSAVADTDSVSVGGHPPDAAFVPPQARILGEAAGQEEYFANVRESFGHLLAETERVRKPRRADQAMREGYDNLLRDQASRTN